MFSQIVLPHFDLPLVKNGELVHPCAKRVSVSGVVTDSVDADSAVADGHLPSGGGWMCGVAKAGEHPNGRRVRTVAYVLIVRDVFAFDAGHRLHAVEHFLPLIGRDSG